MKYPQGITDKSLKITMFRQALFLSGIVSTTLRVPHTQHRCLAVSMDLVKQLRERSGAPIMDCKKALEVPDVAGDMNKAIEWLRKKGIAAADAKAHRVAAEGLVAVQLRGNKCAIVEVNCETDFVARNGDFQEFARLVCDRTLECAPTTTVDIPALLAQQIPSVKLTGKEALAELILKIRENIVVKRAAVLQVPSGAIGSYIHNAVGPNMGKAAAVVALECEKSSSDLESAAKKLAMHIIAAKPPYLDASTVPADVLEREKKIYREQAATSGKPAAIIEKMVQGRINKFLAETTLMGQNHLVEPNNPNIAQYVKQLEQSQGASIAVRGFIRYAIGEETPQS